MRYDTFITEKFFNLFSADDKEKYIDEVWDKLQKSYAAIGGIKGSGFKSKEDMIKNITFWKIKINAGKIKAGVLYKDKSFRKTVAVFTDGSRDGTQDLENILKDDFKRSVIEVSHSLLRFIEKVMPKFAKKYVIDTSDVQELLKKDIEIIDSTYYYRKIGGEKIKKMMLGTKRKLI